MSSVTTRPATVRISAGIAAFLLVSGFVVQSSQAAFSASSDNDGNSFETATVSLSDDATTPLFHYDGSGEADSSAMAPGDSVSECIVVTYGGDTDSLDPLSLAATAPSAGATAGAHFTVFYDVDTGDDTCATATFAGSGDGNWTLDGPLTEVSTGWTPSTTDTTASIRFRVDLSGTAPNSVQGAQVDDVDLTFAVTTP